MNIRNILPIVGAFFVLATAVSGHPTISHRKFVHFSAPVGADQKFNGPAFYQPPRSPGYNVLTES